MSYYYKGKRYTKKPGLKVKVKTWQAGPLTPCTANIQGERKRWSSG